MESTKSNIKTQLEEIQSKAKQVTTRLNQIQNQLLKYEEQYLDVTQMRGNIQRGFDGLTDYKPRNEALVTNIKRKLKASERLLSFSSLSAPISKSDLDRDDEVGIAKKWAEFCNDELQSNSNEEKMKRVKLEQ